MRSDGWYWVQILELGGTYSKPVPAEWVSEAKAWYSKDFTGVPDSQFVVGERIVHLRDCADEDCSFDDLRSDLKGQLEMPADIDMDYFLETAIRALRAANKEGRNMHPNKIQEDTGNAL